MGVWLLLAASALAAPPIIESKTLTLATRSEVVATLTASCAGCSWQRKGHEAAALRVEVDGRYSQHVFLTRGAEASAYKVLLGRLEPGAHEVRVGVDPSRSARSTRGAQIESIDLRAVASDTPEGLRLAHAPILYARPDTLGRFSDVPLLAWVEADKTDGGERLRYSVVFSNEDGGTPSDRLMATWGRLTDIEYVYGVVVGADGRVVSSEFQAPGHAIEPFAGRREGDHPVMYVVTKNNMVSDKGKPTVRFAPAPDLMDLTGVSREVVMDRAPWTYRVTAQEARRERRVNPRAVPGDKVVPDPRRFVTLEACAPAKDATVSFAVRVRDADGTTRDFDSSAGLPNFRIARSPIHFPTGCFRGAVALAAGVTADRVVGLRIRAYTRLPEKDEKPLPKGTGEAHLRSVNRLFFLDERDEPGPNLLEWRGDVRLAAEGPVYEIPIGPR
jgi:hypothetical protein